MIHKHKWHYAHWFQHEFTILFVCECGKIKRVKEK